MTTTTTTTTAMTYEDAMDDVHTRFLLNLPPDEFASADRIFFQIEQAWWFYEDHICDNTTEEELRGIPRYSNLKPFANAIFQYSPLLDPTQFSTMWATFSAYKKQISTYGLILLDSTCTKMILCQTWTGNTWTFPAGKINQGETALDAACRECYEETGFCPLQLHGESVNISNKTWTLSEQVISYQEANNGKRRTFYVCVGVPIDFNFAPVVRKEVAAVQWFEISQLPKRTFAVLPVMGRLRGWIRKYQKQQQQQQGKRPKSRGKGGQGNSSTGRPKSAGRDTMNDRGDSGHATPRTGSQGRNVQHSSTDHSSLLDLGLIKVGEDTRWSEEDMFKTNEALLGRKVDYDGNPHVFAECGFQGIDPHAFRVVGGGFMNSGDGLSHITKAEQISKYQPLVRSGGGNGMSSGDGVDEDDNNALTPFFSQDGATPWGQVVQEAVGGGGGGIFSSAAISADSTSSHLPTILGNPRNTTTTTTSNTTTTKGKSEKVKKEKKSKAKTTTTTTSHHVQEQQELVDVLTDTEITRQSERKAHQKRLERQYEADRAFLNQWAANLPNPTGFRIPNVDAILQRHFD